MKKILNSLSAFIMVGFAQAQTYQPFTPPGGLSLNTSIGRTSQTIRDIASLANGALPAKNGIRTGGSDTGTNVSAAYADSLNSTLASYLSPQPARSHYIFFGGADYLPMVSQDVDALVNSGKVGLYEHANGMAGLSTTDRTAIQNTWGSSGASIVTGGGRGMGESGLFLSNSQYLSYFGGSYPAELNSNAVGNGSYTDTDGNKYGSFFTTSQLADSEAVIDDALNHGAHNYALVVTPNSFDANVIGTDFGTDGYWANLRTAALYGGAISLDFPPSYALWQGDAYFKTVISEIKWGIANHIRVTVIFSPFNQVQGETQPDPIFLINTQRTMERLVNAGAIPTSYVVETYCGCSTDNQPAGDSVSGSTNQVALFMLTQPVSPAGTAKPLSNGSGAASEAKSFGNSSILSPIGSLNTNTQYRTFTSDIQQIPYVGNFGAMAYQSPDNIYIKSGSIGITREGDSAITVFLGQNSSFLTQVPLTFQGGGANGNSSLEGSSDNWLHLANHYSSDLSNIGLAFGTDASAPIVSRTSDGRVSISSGLNFNGGITYTPLLFFSSDSDFTAHPAVAGGTSDHLLHILDSFTTDPTKIGIVFNTKSQETVLGSITGLESNLGLSISGQIVDIDGIAHLKSMTKADIIAQTIVWDGMLANDTDDHVPVISEGGKWYPLQLGAALQ